MKIKWKKLVICIAVPLIVGVVASLLTQNEMAVFEEIVKPRLSVPSWLFPIAWTILYTLMGIATYFVITSNKIYRAKTALVFYGIQLLFNFSWTLIFFNLKAFWFAFIWLVVLWLLIIITTVLFCGISKKAGYLMIPYTIWVTFAAYLNFSIALLN